MRLHNPLTRVPLALVALLLGGMGAGPGAAVAAAPPENTYIVVFDPARPLDRQRLAATGFAIASDPGPSSGVLVVRSSDPAALARMPGVIGVARDRIFMRAPREEPHEIVRAADLGAATPGCASTEAACPRQ
jgi:hypothetical protein